MAIDGKRECPPPIQRPSCFLSVTLAFWRRCFWSRRWPYLGSWDERLHYISVLTGRSLWLQLLRSKHSAFNGILSSVRLMRMKGMERKAPATAALSPISVFTRQAPLPFSLNICLGWRCAPRLAPGGSVREGASVASHFLWKGIRAGSALITSMFTPTHLDPSICRRRWWDHVIRTKVSLSKKTAWKCGTELCERLTNRSGSSGKQRGQS